MGNMTQQENDDDFEHNHFIIYNKTLIILYPCYKAILKILIMLMCSKPYGITGKPQSISKILKAVCHLLRY